MKPLQFEEIYSGMQLWDNHKKKWQKVLRVYLWKDILEENPGRFYVNPPKGEDTHG